MRERLQNEDEIIELTVGDLHDQLREAEAAGVRKGLEAAARLIEHPEPTKKSIRKRWAAEIRALLKEAESEGAEHGTA